jgi:hypothetical protein
MRANQNKLFSFEEFLAIANVSDEAASILPTTESVILFAKQSNAHEIAYQVPKLAALAETADNIRQLQLSFLVIKFSCDAEPIQICLERFKQALVAHDPKVRQITCMLLSNLGYSCFAPELFRLVDDPIDSVSKEAILALLRLRHPQFLKELYYRMHNQTLPSPETQNLTRLLDHQLDEFFFQCVKSAMDHPEFSISRIREVTKSLAPIGHFSLLNKVLQVKDSKLLSCLLEFIAQSQLSSVAIFLATLLAPKNVDPKTKCEINIPYLLEFALFNSLPIKFITQLFAIIEPPKKELAMAINQLQRFMGLKLSEMHSFAELKPALWMMDNLILFLGFQFRCQELVTTILTDYRHNFENLKNLLARIPNSAKEVKERFLLIIQTMELLAKNQTLPAQTLSRLTN